MSLAASARPRVRVRAGSMRADPALRPSAMVSEGGAYRAGSAIANELRAWAPSRASADAAFLPQREEVTARSRDLSRNDGYIAGAIQTQLDAVIGGAGLRLQAFPNWRALGQDRAWAREWSREVEAGFQSWAEDPDYRCDATRQTDFAGLQWIAYWSWFVDGEILALPVWLPRPGWPWATAVQMLPPARLCNPDLKLDGPRLRAGVEIDSFGGAVAYWIARHHPGDRWLGIGLGAERGWERIPRETPWGRRRVIHEFQADEPGLSRGKPKIAAVIESAKLLDHYTRQEAVAAVINAIFAAVIESPYDRSAVGEAMGEEELSAYQDMRSAFHESRALKLDGAKIPHLFPGEKFSFTAPARPNVAFKPFVDSVLRKLAAGAGISFEQVAKDYSQTNYSSARAALLDAWKFLSGRRHFIAQRFCRHVYALWLEEAIETGRVTLPPGSPSFAENKAAWTRSRWNGPGRGWIDPVKEADAAGRRVANMVSTRTQEAADAGYDFEELVEDLAAEAATLREAGLESARQPDAASDRDPTPEPDGDPDADDRRERRPDPRDRDED